MKTIKTMHIAPGVKACVMPEECFKTAVISVSMAVPLADDISANALAAYLMRRCSARYPDFTSLNRRLAELYGAGLSCAVQKIGEAQVITWSITSVGDRFAIDGSEIVADCGKLLLDLIFEPKLENGLFLKEDIELEKRLLLEKINGEFSDKRVYSEQKMLESMCRNERYGLSRFGNTQDIKALTPEQVTAAWRNLLQHGLFQLNVVGSACYENIIDDFKSRLNAVGRGDVCDIHTEYVVSAPEAQKIDEKLPVKQGKLVIGMRAGMTDKDDNYPAIHVMTDMFGGAPYSKLFTNVREKMSLCYYCSARFFRSKGIIVVKSGIEDENEEKATGAILEQLEQMKNGCFTQEDLENSKKGLCDQIAGIEDSPEGIDGWYLSDIFDDEAMTPAEYADKIQNVTMQQVQAAAQNVTVDTVYMLSSNE